MKCAVMLVVLTSTYGCKIDNVDRAAFTAIPIQTIEACERSASILDKKIGVRAFCVDNKSAELDLGMEEAK